MNKAYIIFPLVCTLVFGYVVKYFDSYNAPLFGIALIYYDRRRATRERRISGNLCLTCGYDLRASPIQCPECGQAVVCHNPTYPTQSPHC